jgi:hypothetical protein
MQISLPNFQQVDIMKFEIHELPNNQGYELKSIGQFEPDLILIADHFYQCLTAGNDPTQYKNWYLPYKYTELNQYKLPIQVRYLCGEFYRKDYGKDYFNIQENGQHLMLIYDWIKDQSNVLPEDIVKLLPYNLYNINKYSHDRGYGSLYVIIER